WFPKLEGTGGYTYRKNSTNASQFVFSGPSGDGFQVFSLGFDSSWELDLFGRVHKTIEAACASLCAEREAFRDVLVTLQGDVATNYIQYRVLQRRIGIAENNLAAQRQTWQYVERRLQAGIAGPLEEAQARSNVFATEAEIPALQEQMQVVLNRLAVLLGTAPNAELRAIVDEGPVPTAASAIVAGIPADLVRRRPDVRRAEYEAIRACAEVGIATAELYPQFTLNGTVSVDSRSVDSLFTTPSLAFNVGPSLRWNLFSFGRVRNTIEMRRSQWEASRHAYRQAALRAVEEVENGLVGYAREQERAEALRLAAAAAREAAELSRAEYESGLVNFQSVLDSERQRLISERDLAQSEGNVQLHLVRVYKAMGGGWQCPCGEAADEEVQLAEEGGETPLMADVASPTRGASTPSPTTPPQIVADGGTMVIPAVHGSATDLIAEGSARRSHAFSAPASAAPLLAPPSLANQAAAASPAGSILADKSAAPRSAVRR
ncbi:MAG: TolC family protein, partial [Planctomycetales bacterium]|nr:TolC family protein [Planctomycetales bacterium]